jgi:hypothetical protein
MFVGHARLMYNNIDATGEYQRRVGAGSQPGMQNDRLAKSKVRWPFCQTISIVASARRIINHLIEHMCRSTFEKKKKKIRYAHPVPLFASNTSSALAWAIYFCVQDGRLLLNEGCVVYS